MNLFYGNYLSRLENLIEITIRQLMTHESGVSDFDIKLQSILKTHKHLCGQINVDKFESC